MYLRRLEAVRYGELEGVALGDLGQGLNLCHGPNEAGKSTLTSLIRHVLYGFPRGRTVERLYLPPAGDNRVGRLVFDGDDGEVVVERTEGVRGGEVTTSDTVGKGHGGDLLEILTDGVSGGVYRTVFGFALEELSDVGSLRDIQSRLYATTAGLRVNPYDVVAELRQQADALWAPRARTKLLHTLGKELRQVREERRGVDEVAERYRADRARRDEVAAELEKLEAALHSARVEEERLTALLAEGRRLEEKIADNDEVATEMDLEADRVQREVDAIDVDEDLLAKADAIERLGTRFELFRSEVEQLRRDQDRLREMQRDLQRRARDMGENFSLDEASDVHFDLELENHLAEAEERIQKLRIERDAAVRRTQEARNEHREARKAAEARSEELGLASHEDPRERVAVRMEAVDRLLTLGGAPDLDPWALLPGIGAAAIAAVMLVVGLVLEDRHLAWAAVLPALLAVVLLARTWLQRRATPSEALSLVAVLGLDDVPTPAQLVEIRSRLEGLRQLWATEHQLERKASAQFSAEQAAEQAHEREWAEWLAWLERHNLETPSGQPESVRRVMRLLRDLRTRLESRQELEAQIEGRHTVCREFVDQALKIGAEAEPADGQAAYDGIEHSVRSVLARLGAARRFDDKRRELQADVANARERAEAAGKAAAAAREGLEGVLGRAGVGDGSLADLEAAAAVAKRATAEVETERGELLETRGTLDGRLELGAEESESARLRLAETGIEEKIAGAVESYAVHALAVRLLEQSLESYEAEKQPAVIQRAQEIFAALTGGRYTRLATPLGRFEPVVSDGKGTGKRPEKLSRATAEQLFLALRLSYIENLANAHPALPVIMDDVLVNFDDDRRMVAIKVIADFARTRQVIFFTCHTATVSAFKKAAPKSTVIEMGQAFPSTSMRNSRSEA
jgi:uncharacterized protein YhaN